MEGRYYLPTADKVGSLKNVHSMFVGLSTIWLALFSFKRGIGWEETSGSICLDVIHAVVEKVEECVGEYTIAISFVNIDDGFHWAFTVVYRP